MDPIDNIERAKRPKPGDAPVRVTRHYVLALSLLAIAVLANFCLLQVALQIQESKVRLSALASEQSRLFVDIGFLTRSLMQSTANGKVPEASLDNLRRRVLEKAARARSNMAEILDLDSRGVLGFYGSGAVAKFYTQPPHSLGKKLTQVIERSEEIARLDTQRLRGRLQTWSAIDVVVASGSLMQEEFDAAVAESYRVGRQYVAMLQVVETGVTLTALALIALEGLCIFAPLVRRLKRERDQTLLFERELWDISRQDQLTGLDNRVAFNETLEYFIQDYREKRSPFAVILFDLDRFKPINDMLGHPAGDFVLKTVGARARQAAGAGAVIARLGGDEFGILLQGLSCVSAMQDVVVRLKTTIEQATRYQEHDLKPSASFGAALFPDHAEGAEELLGAADAALYAAKTGRTGFRLYDKAMRAEADTSRQLAIDLRRGLGQGELTAFYQPQVRLENRSLIGFEALIRWQHPVLGLLAPGQFLPVVERHGLMMEITTFMIERVAADVSRWLAAGHDPGTVFVNIPETMLATDIAQQIFTATLDRHGLSYDRMGVEVTENVLLDRNAGGICETLDALRNLGMRVSFDDFGTGYASLSHLRAFPFDELKIDRSFVKDLPDVLMSGEIVRSLITLGQKAGKSVIAEGIETEAQYDFLVEHGCLIGQGYLFSKPVCFEEATKLIVSAPPLQPVQFAPRLVDAEIRHQPVRRTA